MDQGPKLRGSARNKLRDRILFVGLSQSDPSLLNDGEHVVYIKNNKSRNTGVINLDVSPYDFGEKRVK